MRTDYIAVARAIVEHGHPYTDHITRDYGPEGGPVGYSLPGWRWGRLRLQLTTNGSLVLCGGPDDYMGPSIWRVLYDTGVGGRLDGHWADTDRRALRDVVARGRVEV